MSKLEKVNQFLEKFKLDGWLIYDFKSRWGDDRSY